MGETANSLGGVSLAQAQEEIAKASITGGGIKPALAESVPKPTSRDVSQMSCEASIGSAASPAPSFSPAPSLAKSNSATSVGRFSLLSHVSVPVTGSIPYGALHIHRPMDSPQTASSVGSDSKKQQDPIAEAAPSPPVPSCLDAGDVFLILELPEQFTVGIDTVALTVGAGGEFRGFRDIPAGPHLLWVSGPGALTRCGYWFATADGQKEIRVKQWDRYNETLGETASQFELRDQKDNIESVYDKLVPYNVDGEQLQQQRNGQDGPAVAKVEPADGDNPWQQVTSCISRALLQRITGKANTAEWLLDTTDTAKGELHFPQQAHRLLKSVVSGTELHFLFSPDVVDLQLLNLTNLADSSSSNGSIDGDTTVQLLSTLSTAAGDADTGNDDAAAPLVGELQFAFLTGLLLGNGSCTEQWWHLVLKVVLRAHRLVVARPSLCRAVLAALLAQLAYNERYFAASGGEGGCSSVGDGGILDVTPLYRERLREALTAYKRRLNDALLELSLDRRISPAQVAVGHAFADLEAWFWKLGWDLRSDYVEERAGTGVVGGGLDADDDDELLPVVVELDGAGREVGLVSF